MLNNPTKPHMNRRKFIQLSGLSGAVLALGFSIPLPGKDKEMSLENIGTDTPLAKEITPFILIDSAGKIVLINHKPEMGQGTWQAMPVIVAEELDVRLDQVEIQMAKADKKYGDMGVGGSNSVKGSYMHLRKAGAAAREMLVMAAAQTWKVTPAECTTKEGMVYHKGSTRKASYGELVEKASTLAVPKEPRLKDPKTFKLIGKPVPRPDVLEKVDGTAKFGIDVKVPNMLYASVERAPVFHAKVKSVDDTKAKAVPGVKQVLQSERKLNKNTFYGVAVLADNYYAALQGRKALKIQWDTQGHDKVNSQTLYAKFKDLSQAEGHIAHSKGDFEKAYLASAKKLEAVYELPFAAHAPMEPQNCVAHVQDNKCEIWAPTQVPDWARGEVAKYLNMPEENIILHITYLGGGFGRRLFFDSIMEAVHLSKQAGVPVKSVWSREDDMTAGPFRPGTLSVMKGGIDAAGKPLAFQHKVVAPSIGYDNFGSKDPSKREDEGAMEGIKDSAYDFANVKYHNIYAETTMPLGWWRAVYSTTTAFAHESFVDEMAHAAGKDPLQFRLNLITINTRMKKLLTFLGEKSGWSKPVPKGWGKGVAIWQFFAGQAGHVVFVSKNNGQLKIEKIVAAIDCGTAVNPDNVKAQVEGATVMAMMAAMKDEITFEGGKAVQTNFHNYRMMRINEIPPIEVHILPSTEKPDGVGEPGLPPLAPALGNAIFAATGKRIRKLPFKIEEV
jgi:isoquinoline 1-oxidoreductase beta subunit